ncbi:MAG: phage tail tube protein [Thermodesulfobacteriota bacterium]
MAQARGRKAQLLMDFETAFRTAPGSPAAILMPFISVDLKATRPRSASPVVRNNRNPAMPVSGRMDVSGNIVVPIDAIGFGYWLKAMFGAPVTTGAEAPYTHTFKLGDTSPSVLFDKGFTDLAEYYKYLGCKIGSMSIGFGGDGQLQATFTIMGAEEVPSGSPYSATPTTFALTPFEHKHINFKEAGADFDPGTSLKLDVNFNLDGNQYGMNDAGVRQDIPEGIAGVNGSLSTIFSSDALITKAINDTETTLALTLTNGANSLAFTLPEVLLTHTTPPIPGPQGVMLDLSYEAYYQDGADATALKAVLINSQASYA